MGKSRPLVASVLAVLLLGALNAFPPAAAAKGRAKAPAKKSQAKAKTSKKGRTANAPKAAKGGGTKLSKKDRAAARRAAAAAVAARRRELARLAAIRRFDESLREAAADNIASDDMKNEDPYVRQIALSALGSRAGTVVVMDPNNGRVLSIVNQRMAIGTQIKPCSTFKPVVALAALSEHLMDDGDARILRACNCEMDMDDALAYSNNEYFQQLGRQLGLEKLTSYARLYGFGERTGINLTGETGGTLPATIPGDGLGRVASHGDGIGLTAIQLATFVSAIANGGSLYQPQVVAPGKKFTPVLRRQIPIDPKDRRAVLDGMIGAVDYGTAKRARSAFDSIAGKTGTCIGLGSWLGLFASFADVDHPNLVVVVITRGSGSRGKFSADIAGQIYRSLSSRYGNSASRPRRVGDDDTPTLSNR
jgi:cell division protein FtsI/penicillin-binding protein 2